MTKGKILFEFINEWSQLFGSYNWKTFHPIQVEFEDEGFLGAWEVVIVVLGFGFRLRFTYDETKLENIFQESSGNVFLDLGFDEDEANYLQEKSQDTIDGKRETH